MSTTFHPELQPAAAHESTFQGKAQQIPVSVSFMNNPIWQKYFLTLNVCISGVRFVSESSPSCRISSSTSGPTQATSRTSADTQDAPSSFHNSRTCSLTPGPATMTINCTYTIHLLFHYSNYHSPFLRSGSFSSLLAEKSFKVVCSEKQ